MKRYNTFNNVHKGLRALLFDTALKLQQTDLSNDRLAEPVIQQIEAVISLFETHAHHEDKFFNEPLEKVDPAVAHLFEKEHEEDHRLGSVLQTLLQFWREAVSDEVRRATGEDLFFAFNEFMAFNLYHMNKEELRLNEVFWKHYTDDEIRATEQRLVQNLPPQKLMDAGKWMMKGINNAEVIAWLKGVKEHAPTEVFEMLHSLAKNELDAVRFRQVSTALEQRQAIPSV